MRTGRILSAALILGVLFGLAPGQSAWAQNNNNNNAGPLPAGVMVSPEGVLRVKTFTDKTGHLTKTRIAEAKARLAGDLAKPAELRKVSLNRLETAIAERLAAGEIPTEEMKYLAGLTKIEYVFFYPETNDIVVAGPAEGFFPDPSGRVLGINTGRAVLELQDLVAALRAFPPAGKQAHLISVSIDPTKEGLEAMQRWLAEITPRVRPGDADAIVTGLKEKLGLHNVSVKGISDKTHFAQVMVEADYRMKLIGIGIEPPPVKMATYVGKASPTEVSRNAMQRWYFVPNYDCVRVSEDEHAMRLEGQGVKLIGANELVRADGTRAGAGVQNRASEVFCEAFTSNYPQIAAKNAVYAQLKNLIDMSIAAAFIQKMDYYGQADWKMSVLGDENQFPIETYEAPKSVETACTAIWKGNRLMTPVGGGVRIEPLQAIDASHLLKDDQGEVKSAQEKITLDGLAKGQWWWD